MIIQGEERKGRIEANYLRNVLTSDTGLLNKYVRKIYKPLFGEVELLYSAVENLYDADNDLIIKYVIKAPVKKEAGNVVIATDILKLFAKNPFLADSRSLPVYFPSAFRYYFDLHLDVPQGKRPANVPASFSGAMPGNELAFKHNVTYDEATHKIAVSTSIAINAPNTPPANYAYLKAFYQKMYNEVKT
jgi:hypothetical protein